VDKPPDVQRLELFFSDSFRDIFVAVFFEEFYETEVYVTNCLRTFEYHAGNKLHKRCPELYLLVSIICIKYATTANYEEFFTTRVVGQRN